MARTRKAQNVQAARPFVAEICLYGTHDARVGAGYLGVIWPHGQTFGTGDPEPGRIFTEALWMAVGELRARKVTRGIVRVFDSGGQRMSDIDIAAFLPDYGSMKWVPAVVHVISVDALMAAAEQQ